MLLTFLAIAGIAWIRSGVPGERSDVYLDIATLAAALIGGTIGFLWYNAFRPRSSWGHRLDFGGAIAGFAIDGNRDPATAHRGDLRDRGPVADHPGGQLQEDGPARIPWRRSTTTSR